MFVYKYAQVKYIPISMCLSLHIRVEYAYVRTLSNIIWDTLKNFKQFHLANCALHNERHLLPKTSDSGRQPASQPASQPDQRM